MPNLRDIFGDRPMSESWTYQCRQGTVRLRFARDIPQTDESRKAVGGSYVTETNAKGGFVRGYPVTEFASLPLLTTKIRIEIVPIDINASKVTATVPAVEAMEIFDGLPPSDETYDEVLRQVRDRRSPPPTGTVPGLISLTAQGQTKKPGSHSHDKHK
jgi:hypothetical protein